MWFKSNFTIPAVAAISFCLIGVTSPAAADILHVPGDFATIQAGIDAAVNGDEVVVADGTYTGDGNRDLDFGGKLITVRSEAGPDNCIIDCEGTEFDPHRGFYFHSGETNDAIVEGFTIRNGSVGNGWDSPDSFGGAIRCDASSPAITNCVITNNTAIGHYQGRGGGIFCGDGASPTITNCTISGNLAVGHDDAGHGGGIYSGGGSPTITNCTISDNSAGNGIRPSFGGGIRCVGGSPTISDCSITGNGAGIGGGIACLSSAVSITNCTISGNQAFYTFGFGSGGGLQLAGVGVTATVTNCVIMDNVCSRNPYGGGGGINCSSTILANCVISGNSSFGNGGGILCGGLTTVVNCVIAGNSTENDGGGIASASGSPSISNCTISGNTAIWRGGGIASIGVSAGTGPSLSNTILWHNGAALGDELALVLGLGDEPATLTVSYCDVLGGVEAVYVEDRCQLVWGDGNINADPMLVDPGSDDYHISPGSPCIDAADNTAVPKGIDTDLDGNPRFVDDPDTKDTGFGDPPIVDMGAYEFQASTCPWDLDSNGSVGAGDLLLLLANWGNPYGAGDLLALLADWGACP